MISIIAYPIPILFLLIVIISKINSNIPSYSCQFNITAIQSIAHSLHYCHLIPEFNFIVLNFIFTTYLISSSIRSTNYWHSD